MVFGGRFRISCVWVRVLRCSSFSTVWFFVPFVCARFGVRSVGVRALVFRRPLGVACLVSAFCFRAVRCCSMWCPPVPAVFGCFGVLCVFVRCVGGSSWTFSVDALTLVGGLPLRDVLRGMPRFWVGGSAFFVCYIRLRSRWYPLGRSTKGPCALDFSSPSRLSTEGADVSFCSVCTDRVGARG